MRNFYVTTRCNRAHRLSDGKPIEHECEIVPPAALEAERAGDFDKAIDILEKAKTTLVYGRRSLPISKGVK